MSSSFRNRYLGFAAAALLGVGLTPGAWAQQTLYYPGVEVSSVWDSNHQLSQNEESTTGYRATLDTRIRRITPRSDTELRPQISYQKYSGRSDVDSLEGLFDVRSRYRT